MGGGIPSDYLVSTQLQLWLFCCWGCGCCWAVTIKAAFVISSDAALDFTEVFAVDASLVSEVHVSSVDASVERSVPPLEIGSHNAVKARSVDTLEVSSVNALEVKSL